MLLSTPLPLLKPPSSRLLSRSFALFPVSLPSHCSQPARLPSRLRSIGKWPEWEKMVECVESLNSEDDFAEDVPEDFAAAARSCLLFARLRPDLLRSLPKRDIEIIVDNSSPFLFKNAHGSIHRMNAFIREKNDPGNKPAYTVDLMKYLVTCVYHHHRRGFSEEERNPGNLVESSARILLHQLTQLNNSKNKLGSLRQLTGTEWECPQCQFFNNPRNASCLRCDFSRPENEISESNKAPDVEERNETLESEISLKLDRILGRLSSPEEEVNEFSETMPMRKGENRFVVSKKKDRSLTSPQYKRRAAMDQAASSNFVPFVPFPPGYFAKDNDNNNGNDNSNDNGNDDEGKAADEERGKVNKKEEADRKDMSEEAKAERWFKRTAQINDISELSNIPDEDFPEIMPMRKGVNRFVVSKRKTPLERRLTSPQRRSGLSQEKSTSGIPFSDEEQ